MSDPSLHLTESVAPRTGVPDDPGAEVLGEPAVPADIPVPPWVPPPVPVDEPTARRWRFGPRSLTGRLVTGVVALVAILVLATGTGTYFALRSFLYKRLDQQLVSAAQPRSAMGYFGQFGGGPNLPSAPQKVWAVALASSGGVIEEPTNPHLALPMGLSAGQRATLAGRTYTTVGITTTDGQRLRVRVVPLYNPSGARAGVVAVGLSTNDVHNTLGTLILLEWIIGGSAVLVAFGATFGGVRFSLRRLHRVTATAQEVAAELSPEGAGLDRRVPVDDAGTEVGALAESMNTLLAAVETQFAARLESEQRMRQFLADASHELRTPLTSIRGYAELARMQRAYGGTDPANLDRIESEGTRMSRLIDDLLMLARSDQANGVEPVREFVDVDALLDDVVSGARAAFPQRDIRLAVPPGVSVLGDPDQLVRAIRNLVTNAATHTRPDGPIGVTARGEGDTVVIQVADSGPGLPPEQAAHVFERFWRADKARTRARGGSGLGMSIVASIASAHGGTVRFDSAVESGSTVTVRLPAGSA